MSALPEQSLNERVARALAESMHLRIDPSQLKDVPGYSAMVGGFGIVRVARLEDQVVAVKELRIVGDATDRARFSMRFARELKVWAPLDHPNLLKLLGFYVDLDMAIAQFVCPFYAYGHIGKYIKAEKPDSVVRLKLAGDTAMGLQHLHELHIVHGDLKELNVLVDPEPRALLCDYGLAKMMDPDGTNSGLTTTSIPVSIRFSSPELLEVSRPDLASDIWAWGCLFLKIVADINPYENITDMACIVRITRGVPPAIASGLNMSRRFRDMLGRCWSRDPSGRPSITECLNIISEMRGWRQHLFLKGHSEDITSIAFLQGTSLLATASNDHTVRIWDVDSGINTAILDCGTSVFATTFSLIGMRLACGLSWGGVRIWDGVPGTSSASTGSHTSWNETFKLSMAKITNSVIFSPDGSKLAAGLGDNTVQIWDVVSGASLFTLRGHDSVVSRVDFSPDGLWLASCSWDKTVRIWHAIAETSPRISSKRSPIKTLEGHTSAVNTFIFSPNGNWLASGSTDQTVRIWDASSWTAVTILRTGSIVQSLTVSPDGARLVSGTQLFEVQLWDTASWAPLITLISNNRSVTAVAFSSDGRKIASSSQGKIQIWDARPTAIRDMPGSPDRTE